MFAPAALARTVAGLFATALFAGTCVFGAIAPAAIAAPVAATAAAHT